MKRAWRARVSTLLAVIMLLVLAAGGGTALAADDVLVSSVTVDSRIQSLVFGCAANIPVAVKFDGVPAAAVYAALYSGDAAISPEVPVVDGAATIKIPALSVDGTVKVGVRFEGAAVTAWSADIPVVSPAASIWEPVAVVYGANTITLCFSEKISPSGAYKITINGVEFPAFSTGQNRVSFEATMADITGPIVISNVKYYELFPSYKFTFSITKFISHPELTSISMPETVFVGQDFAVTVKTDTKVLDMALGSHKTGTLPLTDYYVETNRYYSDIDGVRTWVLTGKLGEAGDHMFFILYNDEYGNLYGKNISTPVTAIADPTPAPVSRSMPTRASVHDPSIVKDPNSNYYYVFGSNRAIARSSDLINWSTSMTPAANLLGSNTANRVANIGGSYAWAGYADGSTNARTGEALYAPDAVYNPYYDNGDGTFGAYMYYYCVSSNFKRGAIGFGVSTAMTGMYNYRATIQYSGFTLHGGPDEPGVTVDTIWTNTNIDELIAAGVLKPGPDDVTPGLNPKWFNAEGGYNSVEYPEDIDPTVFFDKENKLWMIYGAHNGGLFMLELDRATGMPIYPGVDGLTAGGNQIDRYFGIRVGGGFYRGGEGGYIIYDPATDYYYLLTVYGQISAGYNLRLFRSKDVTGPYLDSAGNNAAFASGADVTETAGIKLIGNYRFSTLSSSISGGGYKYAGHGSLLIEAGQMYMFYHQRFASGSSNQVRTHQMFQNQDGWPVTAVFENTGDVISPTGYAKDEIVGTYEFINHGSQTSTAMLDTLIVDLNADGTVTGDVAGTWSMTAGTHFMNITINGVPYNGVFFKQQDESNTVSKVMTFSAVGNNNECIWGARMAHSDSDLKAVTAAASALTLPYNALTNAQANPATTDIPLLNKWIYGTDIAWTSSDPAVISADGKVTRGAEDVTVSLTAIIIRGSAVTTKAFSVRVKALSETAEAFTLAPLYNYGFSTADGYLTMNTGSLVGIGTLVGGAKVVNDEYKGPVLEINGTGSALKPPNDSLKGITSGFTVSMWVNPDSESNLLSAMKGDFTLLLNSGMGANIMAGGKGLAATPSTALEPGKWSFVALTVSKTGIATYVNGAPLSSMAADLSEVFEDGYLEDLFIRIGNGFGSFKADDVKIYGIALNASQVASLIDPNVAWQTAWRIDFGTETSPVEGGFVAMNNTAVYKKIPMIQCFGFETAPLANETAEGGNKFRDCVYMPGGQKYTFCMDLPNGTYTVYVYTGAKDSANTTNFTIQDDPTVYTHETPPGVGSDNHPPLASLCTFTVAVTDNLLKMTFWGDDTLGADAITGRLGSLEITRVS